MNFLANYGLFLLKTMTIVIAVIAILITFFVLAQKEKQGKEKGKLEITNLNEKYEAIFNQIKQVILPREEFKQFQKDQKLSQKKTDKKSEKEKTKKQKKRVFVLNFDGDIKASDTGPLTKAINTVLSVATKQDEILVCLESQGGVVHGYGLASSQLQRIRDAKIPLTVAIDKVAASGGYMMACVANQIIAAPFAIVGSIGVLAQIPNFHRLLKKHDVDFEQITAGKYKRTLTMLGKNTDAGRKKFQEEIEETHVLFKDFIKENRPQVDVEKVATGEYWQAKQAIDFKLVDKLMTSDEYLMSLLEKADLYKVQYTLKKSLGDRIGLFAHVLIDRFINSVREKNSEHDLVG